MTANKRISQRKVDIMFEVRSLHWKSSISCLTCNVYQRCDLNKDGRLDYSEFKMLIFRNRERKEPSRGEEKTKMTSRRKSCKIPETEK